MQLKARTPWSECHDEVHPVVLSLRVDLYSWLSGAMRRVSAAGRICRFFAGYSLHGVQL